jgi:2-iminobutanoate/2-iminopropanoate deaminase
MAKKVVICTDKAPAPLQGAPYSQAIKVDNLVFVSGQIALKPGETALTGATVGEQTEQVFANLKAILDSCGSGLDRLVKTTVFLARMEDFAEMNEVYKRHAGAEPPARSTVQAAKLPAGALVEIDAIAHL